jgi:hypothetical protein
MRTVGILSPLSIESIQKRKISLESLNDQI